ncbi:hypothetical protein [Enterobacter hormaechei]|uniref:hypothetical protein n=1 Tax=Enterobacter hormaechei TaxID=158836 RepID=UPI003D702171
MSTITKEFTKEQLQQIIETDHVQCGEASVLARIALASLEAKPVSVNDDMAYAFHHAISDSSLGSDEVEEIKAGLRAAFANVTAQPAPASVPDDVSGPLAHAYKELTPTFMRNHIDVFERYGIYPDGSAGIQAMRIALDGMNRRAAMLQGAERVTTAYKLPEIGWLRADYQDDNRGLRGNAPLFVLGKKDPSSVWGLDYIPLTAKSPVIPEGWVMVPIEPTADMREAYHQAQAEYEDVDGLWSPDHQWQAMLAAAPKQEAK